MDTLIEIGKIGRKEGLLKTTEYEIIVRMCQDLPSINGTELIYLLNDEDINEKHVQKCNIGKILNYVKSNNPWTKIITIPRKSDKMKER